MMFKPHLSHSVGGGFTHLNSSFPFESFCSHLVKCGILHPRHLGCQCVHPRGFRRFQDRALWAWGLPEGRVKGPSILRSVPRKHSALSVDLCGGHKPAAMHSPDALQAGVTEPAGNVRHLRHAFRARTVKWRVLSGPR